MKKVSVTILACVVLFVLTLGVFLLTRRRAAQSDSTDPPLTNATFRVKDIHLQEEGSGNILWKLDADHAEVFEQEGKTVLRGVTITIQEADRAWKVTGEEGDLLDATKDVTIRKNVVLTSSDGTRLETDHLRWQAREKMVWTDTPVTLSRKGAVVTGQGLETRLAEERTAVKGPVRATFTRGRSVPSVSPVAGLSEGQ